MERNEPKTLQLISVRWWNASAYYGVSLAEALNQAGIPAIVGGRENSPPLEKAREFNQPTFTEVNLESLNPLVATRSLRQLKKFLKKETISLINAHRPEDGLFGVLAKKISATGIPIIRTVSDVRPPKDNATNKWLHEKGMDFLIFSCRASYERYQSVWPIFEDKSAVIYSAIDTEIFRPTNDAPALRKEFGIADTDILIGIIARLDPVKDHHTFLKAAAKVAKRAPHARFLISGEACNVSHEELRQLSRELSIYEWVIFLDRQEDLDVRDLIHALDIGVVASNGSEVICRISVEYMALGKPQVSTDINVLPEIVENGKNGFVVPAGDAEAMAARLLRLVENAELRKKMGQQARRIAEEKYSYRVFAEKTLDVYREVLGRSRGSSSGQEQEQ